MDKINRTIFGKPPDSALTLRRNDPCWCGSGKKYKRCHEEKDRKYYASRGSGCKPSG
jgi:uncharacterized protein YecA (UPF0149 family)